MSVTPFDFHCNSESHVGSVVSSYASEKTGLGMTEIPDTGMDLRQGRCRGRGGIHQAVSAAGSREPKQYFLYLTHEENNNKVQRGSGTFLVGNKCVTDHRQWRVSLAISSLSPPRDFLMKCTWKATRSDLKYCPESNTQNTNGDASLSRDVFCACDSRMIRCKSYSATISKAESTKKHLGTWSEKVRCYI